MSIYELKHHPLPTHLDEIGFKFGLERLPKETLREYKGRLLEQHNDRTIQNTYSVYRSFCRLVGLKIIPVLTIDLNLVGDTPSAPAPRLEITASRLKIWDDYTNDSLVLDLDLLNREDGYFLEDILNNIGALTDFTVAEGDAYSAYLKSHYLLPITSDRTVERQRLLNSRTNTLEPYVRQAWFDNFTIFQTEVASFAEVDGTGKYYVDRDHGLVHSHDVGVSNITYIYANFPITLYWSPILIKEMNLDDITGILNREIISDDTGESEKLALDRIDIINYLLNIYGAY